MFWLTFGNTKRRWIFVSGDCDARIVIMELAATVRVVCGGGGGFSGDGG